MKCLIRVVYNVPEIGYGWLLCRKSLIIKRHKIMNSEEITKQIEKNRSLIDQALSMNDTEMMYYIVRKLAKQNEKLIEKLKILSQS